MKRVSKEGELKSVVTEMLGILLVLLISVYISGSRAVLWSEVLLSGYMYYRGYKEGARGTGENSYSLLLGIYSGIIIRIVYSISGKMTIMEAMRNAGCIGYIKDNELWSGIELILLFYISYVIGKLMQEQFGKKVERYLLIGVLFWVIAGIMESGDGLVWELWEKVSGKASQGVGVLSIILVMLLIGEQSSERIYK